MPILQEKELPNLCFPGLNSESLKPMRRVKIGPNGQLYIPREPVRRGEINYHEVELGLDVAIRQARHIRAGLKERREQTETALPTTDFHHFQQARDELFTKNDAQQRKYMDIDWILEHAFEYTHNVIARASVIVGQLASLDIFDLQNKRATGPNWNIYYSFVGAELSVARTALERVQVKPYVQTTNQVIEQTKILPTNTEFGDNLDEVWRIFIQEGRAKDTFSQMHESLAKTLREHADPELCCPITEEKVAA